MFDMRSKIRNFLKAKWITISFSTLKSYSFDKVDKYLSEAESIALKCLTASKDFFIKKAGKGNAVVITEATKYLEGIKFLLSYSSRFMQLSIDEGKWIKVSE